MALHLVLTTTRRLHRFSDSLHSKQRQAHPHLASLRLALSVLYQEEVKRLDRHLATPPRRSPHHSTSWAVVKMHLPRNPCPSQHQARHRARSRDSANQSSRLLHQVHLVSLPSRLRRTVRAQGLEASALHQQRAALQSKQSRIRQLLLSVSQSRAHPRLCSANLPNQLDRSWKKVVTLPRTTLLQ